VLAVSLARNKLVVDVRGTYIGGEWRSFLSKECYRTTVAPACPILEVRLSNTPIGELRCITSEAKAVRLVLIDYFIRTATIDQMATDLAAIIRAGVAVQWDIYMFGRFLPRLPRDGTLADVDLPASVRNNLGPGVGKVCFKTCQDWIKQQRADGEKEVEPVFDDEVPVNGPGFFGSWQMWVDSVRPY
jgi:hypothetical protein